MDRAEAIKVLEQEQSYLIGGASPNINEYDDAIKMAIAALREQEHKWISVEERLPEYGVSVLVADAREGFIGKWWLKAGTDTRNGKDFWVDDSDYGFSFAEVTHWMPLPEPPEV